MALAAETELAAAGCGVRAGGGYITGAKSIKTNCWQDKTTHQDVAFTPSPARRPTRSGSSTDNVGSIGSY